MSEDGGENVRMSFHVVGSEVNKNETNFSYDDESTKGPV
jgi:hypothetical protein